MVDLLFAEEDFFRPLELESQIRLEDGDLRAAGHRRVMQVDGQVEGLALARHEVENHGLVFLGRQSPDVPAKDAFPAGSRLGSGRSCAGLGRNQVGPFGQVDGHVQVLGRHGAEVFDRDVEDRLATDVNSLRPDSLDVQNRALANEQNLRRR